MKICFLGDSITAGGCSDGIENCYFFLVGKTLGVEARGFGQGGTRIAKQRSPSVEAVYDEDFQKRALAMDKDADFVFVFGGTNDYGHGDAPIGEFSDKNPYTFYGGLRTLVEYMVGVYGKEKLCFITPLHRYDEQNVHGERGEKPVPSLPLSGYVEIIKEVTVYYGVDCLDLYTPPLFPAPTTDKGDEYTADGLHPNRKGHALLAARICEYVKGKFPSRF